MSYNYRIEAWFTEESFPRSCVPALQKFARKHDLKLKFQTETIRLEMEPMFYACILKLAARTKEVAAIAWDHFQLHHFPGTKPKKKWGVYRSTSHVKLFI